MAEERFGALMGALDAPMAVVTTTAGGERGGCLIGFHAQSSIDPARYTVWLSKANHTYRLALRASHLAVHFLAAVGDPTLIGSADQLAAWAGLAPVSRDSGKRTGRLHTPKRYSRRLRRVMYMSALTAIRCDPHSKAYYQRKRDEGKRPIPATLCLARRRTNVLYALIRDNRTWQPESPPITKSAA